MGNESSSSGSSKILVYGLLVVAVVALVVVSLAYFNASEARDLAKTREVAMEQLISALEAELEKPLVFEYNLAPNAGKPMLYLQVRPERKVVFYNNTELQTVEITADYGLFIDLQGNTTQIDPGDHQTYTIGPEVPEGKVFFINAREADGTDHGGGSMIVGSGP